MLQTDTRQQLIEATGRMILRLGYQKTSVADIAGEAGLSRATAYLYFSTKEAMLSAWLGHRFQQFCRELRETARAWSDPWQALEEALKARILLRLERASRFHQNTLHEILAVREAVLSARPEQQAEEARLLEELILRARPGHPGAAQTAHVLVLATDCLRPSNLSAEQLKDLPALDRQAKQLCAFLVESLRLGASA
ncbi:hypothetical protein ABS71_21975 [bacterium SCN 62-11]|nr:TetR/AcrR family transcriptional regulator [Candidatus Eremiobacteraeota bacterium]ODT56337.1 MAG: hypothetical protein ABS71_21975 [bacterium SCN 62-11]